MAGISAFCSSRDYAWPCMRGAPRSGCPDACTYFHLTISIFHSMQNGMMTQLFCVPGSSSRATMVTGDGCGCRAASGTRHQAASPASASASAVSIGPGIPGIPGIGIGIGIPGIGISGCGHAVRCSGHLSCTCSSGQSVCMQPCTCVCGGL